MNLLTNNWKSFVIVLSIPIWLNFGAYCAKANADREPKYKIAIIDSGYNPEMVVGPKLKLCKYGHYDFDSRKRGISSTHLHGTQIAEIMAKILVDVDYCAVILNVMTSDKKNMPIEYIVDAFERASYLNVNAINASYAGLGQSIEERDAIIDTVKRVPKVFVAAGNNRMNLDIECLAFPTCFKIPHVISVGAMNFDGIGRAHSSNYGTPVQMWFSGYYPRHETTTSYAVPRAVAAYIRSLDVPPLASK